MWDRESGGTPVGVRRIVPNLMTDDTDLGREFFAGLLGLRVGMKMGWIATYVSHSDPAVQVSVLHADPTVPQPAVSIEVDDVDRVHHEAVAAGYKIVYPLTVEPWGVRRFFVAGPGGVIVNVLSHAISPETET